GDSVGQQGARVRKTLWDVHYAFNASNLENFPLAPTSPLELTGALLSEAATCVASTPEAIVSTGIPTAEALAEARERWHRARARMIALQEELDWFCYRAYGVVQDDFQYASMGFPALSLGERAFEIVLARRVAAGEAETAWFERHGSKPTTELPGHWPADYRRLVERRIALIESNRD